jgi:Adenine-specific methyltransferase EcoRI
LGWVYDNYDAINIDKTKEIPMDYDGVMGVPITFMDKYNPDQFEILGAEEFENIEVRQGLFQKPTHKLINSNRLVYKRIWIKNKKTNFK